MFISIVGKSDASQLLRKKLRTIKTSYDDYHARSTIRSWVGCRASGCTPFKLAAGRDPTRCQEWISLVYRGPPD
eukprot:scaffold5181_cov62-Cyclotella_meneghiniana.AAC.1